MTNRIPLSEIDQSLALTLAEAAFVAYPTASYKPPHLPPDPTPPNGYTFVKWWWGKNLIAWGGYEEVYGAIFKETAGTKGANPKHNYILAFKGTATKSDGFEDVWANKVDFPFYRNGNQAPTVHVSDGFNSIYTAQVAKHIDSMQKQLFDYLDGVQNDINTLYITGHSLGSGLCELFTMDLLNAGSYSFPVINYNFACPRVGAKSFASYYRQLETKQPTNKTIRFVNFYDYIPCLPFETVTDYYHGSDYFLFNSQWDVRWWKKYAHPVITVEIRHSMYNYWHALKNAIFPHPNKTTHVQGLHHKLICSTPASGVKECNGGYLWKLLMKIWRKIVNL